MSKKTKIAFKMAMSESITLSSEAQLNIPDSASMPYSLTKIASRASSILPDIELDKNYATVLMWFYNRHFLHNHGLHSHDTVTKAIVDTMLSLLDNDTSISEINKTAASVAKMIVMPDESLKVIDALSVSDQSSLVCGAIVWSMLVNNRTITTETDIDFIDLLDSCDRSKGYMCQLKAAISLVNRTVELKLREREPQYSEELLLTSEKPPETTH